MRWLVHAAAAALIVAPASVKAATYVLTEDQFYSGSPYAPEAPQSGAGSSFFPATPGVTYKVSISSPGGFVSGLIDQTLTISSTDYFPPPAPPETDTAPDEITTLLTLSANGDILSAIYHFPKNTVQNYYYQGVLDQSIADDYFPQIGLFADVKTYDPDALLTVVIDPVPEPSGYALAIGGLGLVGALLRRRRSVAPQAVAASAR